MRLLILGALVALMAACATTIYPDNPAHPWNSAVMVSVNGGHGSGVIVGPGRIATAAHVVSHGKQDTDYTITFYDGFTRHVTQGDWDDVGKPGTATDWAVGSVDAPKYIHPVKAYCGPLMLGQEVYHVGYPNVATRKVIHGYISSLDVGEAMRNFQHTVAVDMDSGAGSSGGPMFDRSGRLIGFLVGAAAYTAGSTFSRIATGSFMVITRLPEELC